MRFLLVTLVAVSICNAQLSLTTIKLPSELEETSGLELFGDNLLTLNDSGDKAVLYEFTKEGELVKSIRFYDLKNKDWEDLAGDETSYYIADTGNNYATRENLKIYILSKDFYPKGTIRIRYEAQKTFSKEIRNAYDAEALAAVGDQLVLFSKNRLTLQSEIYTLPKIEGSYSLIPSASINTESLITAADYKEEFDLMVLTGYTFEGLQYFYTLENFVANGYDNLNLKRYLIPVKPAQIEGVKIINDTEFWITSESEAKGTPRLFHLKLKRPE
ncbi:MAG: hypothetical protein O3C56_04305 [Bacteroidetes bacterium]|nr:hypothetical protein [Bacteroidota bacterium]